MVHFELFFCIWCEVRGPISFFTCGCPLVPAPFAEKTTFSPLNGLGALTENQLVIDVWVYVWTLNSILLVYMPTFMLVPQCFDYCVSVVSKTGKWESSNLGAITNKTAVYTHVQVFVDICFHLSWVNTYK